MSVSLTVHIDSGMPDSHIVTLELMAEAEGKKVSEVYEEGCGRSHSYIATTSAWLHVQRGTASFEGDGGGGHVTDRGTLVIASLITGTSLVIPSFPRRSD